MKNKKVTYADHWLEWYGEVMKDRNGKVNYYTYKEADKISKQFQIDGVEVRVCRNINELNQFFL